MLTLVAGIQQLSNHIKSLCNYNPKRLDLMEVWGNMICRDEELPKSSKVSVQKNGICKLTKSVFWALVAKWWASVSGSVQGFQVFSVWSLTMFPTRFSVLPPQSTDIHNRLICDYKMHTGVNVSVTGCLFLHVSPVIDWWHVQHVTPTPHPVLAGTCSSLLWPYKFQQCS